MNRVVHFEIHAEDPARASKFYSDVFGWDIQKWGDMPYWVVMTKGKDKSEDTSKWPGIDGGLVPRKGAAPEDGAATNAFVCTMDVENLDAMLTSVNTAGGTTVVPKYAIPTMGWIAYCKDTEGNIFGMMQADPTAK
ncbi:MAG: glyoxalase [Candidatus Andersenbacteria bacterium RIFCSPHIGHO2_02_FULL_45_11]|uniref:Glyoxalase n=1 Tax=Candidatus Andersenbacteria bacterium RIFCSPHIGHO2_12_FULL_45_11 TaxID=1797281 RepID=A0A1G1X5G9_9BACT|nr:MAG: glyoxalase [Candidatus Andersenbacteria bacterium RIFCSPHIGHO2_02_FULL_45_11]OGY35258.1 MAG: glyoxalase [Candidatus Andersenbacteria bacterium RIFCSPHIGHO2_12_FULL_45_11]